MCVERGPPTIGPILPDHVSIDAVNVGSTHLQHLKPLLLTKQRNSALNGGGAELGELTKGVLANHHSILLVHLLDERPKHSVGRLRMPISA